MQPAADVGERYEPVGMDASDFDGPPDDFQEASYVPDDMAPDGFVPDDAMYAALAGGRKKTKAQRLKSMTAQEWPGQAAALPETGWAAKLARQGEWVGVEGEQLILRVAILSREDSDARLR